MTISCSQCGRQLPEVETLEYRSCPHCGAEVATDPRPLDDVYVTIPPDSVPAPAEHRPPDLSPDADKKLAADEPFDEHTIEPQPLSPQKRPEIRPPDSPPPSSFFRTPPQQPQQPSAEQKKPPTKTVKRVMIAVLILLGVVILIMGGLFTF